MGSNDAAEMLEVAKEECGRLEREVAELKRHEALAEKHWHRDQADLALIVAERDAALAVIAAASVIASRNTWAAETVCMIRAGLAQSPTDALAAHDASVIAAAFDEWGEIMHRDMSIGADDRPVGWSRRIHARAATYRSESPATSGGES